MKYVAFFLLSLLVVVSLAPASVAQIRLNEILADPGIDWNGDGNVDSKLDEWVEIVNTGASQVDLSKFRISDAAAATDFRFRTLGDDRSRAKCGCISVPTWWRGRPRTVWASWD